jgi:predicted DNA binding CopG/RHH family protein
MTKKCKTCRQVMYQDDRGQWFCPDCILEEIEPAFLDEEREDRGELKRPYVLEPPTKQVSIRLPVTDLERAKRLARRKGIPKYQSYIKTLLHEALIKEASQDQEKKSRRAV